MASVRLVLQAYGALVCCSSGIIRQFRKGPSRKLVFGNPHTLAIGPGQRAVFTSRSTRRLPQHLVPVHLYSEALGLLVFSASKVEGIRGSTSLFLRAGTPS